MRTFLVCALALAAGCAVEGDLGSEGRAVIGGVPASGYGSSCILDIVRPPLDDGTPQDPIVCGCSLIADRIVVTAADCVEDNVDDENRADITLRFGTDRGGDPVAVEAVELHRYFDPDIAGTNDIALLRIAETPAGATPAAFSDDAELAVGDMVTLVGYGVREQGADPTEPANTGSRRVVDTPITTANPDHILAGTTEATTCAGDSGSPVFTGPADAPVQVAITSFLTECRASVPRPRLDYHAETFLRPYIARFDAECPADGTCDEDCTTQTDPDCDPCAWQGLEGDDDCAADCPTRDWDCPLGSFVGEACELDGDCEMGGRCVAAADDESFTFCTQPCDLDATTGACPVGMECADLGEGGECVWLTPSPGSQGFACTDGSQCRSGICEDTICVTQCDPSQADACAEPYVCGDSKVSPGTTVCLGQDLSGGGGFCAISPAGSSSAERRGVLALFALTVCGMVFVLRRRRR